MITYSMISHIQLIIKLYIIEKASNFFPIHRAAQNPIYSSEVTKNENPILFDLERP